MGLYERIKEVASKKGYSINKLENELKFPRSSISKYDINSPSISKIQKISELLNVSVSELIGDEKENQSSETLSDQEELDIINDVDMIITRLKKGEEVVLRFNGEKTDDEGIELLRQSLLNTCRTAKLISKQKE